MEHSEKFAIQGMHCASCVNYIEKTLGGLPEVQNIQIDLVNETCNLEYDHNITNLNELNSKIKNAGYTLVPQNILSEKMDSMIGMGDMEGMDNSISEGSKSGMSTNMKIGLYLTGLSFLMIFWESAIQLAILPQMSDIVYQAIHHAMPIAATFMILTQGKQYLQGIKNFIRSGHANMDTLTGIGVVVAFIYSFMITAFEIPLIPYLDTTRGFYDVVIILIGLIGLGKFIETRAKKKTTEAVKKLIELTAKSAIIKINNEFVEKDISQLVVGDIAVVKVGMNIPVDGKIVSGFGMIDESTISGESVPVSKTLGNSVYAGSNLKNGYLEVEVSTTGMDTKLGKITKLVENAMISKAPIQKLADVVSAYFTIGVLIIAFVSLLGWILFGYVYRDSLLSTKMAISSFVSILIVACPCAMGLATPLAIARGVGEAARNGILFKNAESIQKIKDVDILIFDKTGTLTNGKFEIVNREINDKTVSKDEIDKIMFALESKSNHPISLLFTSNKIIDIPQVENVVVANNGVSGFIGMDNYRVGNAEFVGILSNKSELGTYIYLSKNSKTIASFVIMDEPKIGIKKTLEILRLQDIKTYLATGDKKEIALQIGTNLGFEEREIFFELKPEDKLSIIENFHKQGNTVAMFGDGINDSPALAKADVGVAMGNGSEIALDTADVAILNGDMSKLPIMFELSKSTFRNIQQNLFWAFSYNIVMIPIATGVFFLPFGILLSPISDAIAMSFSSIAVVLNSTRIKAKKINSF